MSTVINSEWLKYGWLLFSSLGFLSLKIPKVQIKKNLESRREKNDPKNEKEEEKMGSRETRQATTSVNSWVERNAGNPNLVMKR